MEITLKKKKAPVKNAPVKTSVNLVIQEKKKEKNILAILLFLLYLAALAFFVKFMVLDPLNRMNAEEASYYSMEQSLEKMQLSNSRIDEVRNEYSHYGNGYLNEEEAAEQPMMSMLEVIDEQLISKNALLSVNISNNVAVLTINSKKISNVADIVIALEEHEIVDYVTVATVSENKSDLKDAAGTTAGTQQRGGETMGQLLAENREAHEEAAAMTLNAAEAEDVSGNVITTMTIYFKASDGSSYNLSSLQDSKEEEEEEEDLY